MGEKVESFFAAFQEDGPKGPDEESADESAVKRSLADSWCFVHRSGF